MISLVILHSDVIPWLLYECLEMNVTSDIINEIHGSLTLLTEWHLGACLKGEASVVICKSRPIESVLGDSSSACRSLR